jgi:hypothetical protein
MCFVLNFKVSMVVLMVPKVRFVVSRPFYQNFLPQIYSEELVNETLESTENFERFYKPLEERIFLKMQELLGGSFRDDFIDVYVLPKGSNVISTSNPLLVYILPFELKSPYRLLKDLIHELVHYYFSTSPEFQPFIDKYHDLKYDDLEEHVFVMWATDKILLSLFDKDTIERKKMLEERRPKYKIWQKKGLKLGDLKNLVGLFKEGKKFNLD